MSRQRLKTILATFLASVLFYYSAAWAVLRCCHYEGSASVERSISANDTHDGLHLHFSGSSHAPIQIDCLDIEYHTEILAGPASPPQFHRVTALVAPFANDFIVLKSLKDSHNNKTLRDVFTRGSLPGDPSDPPLYICLSSLRI